MINIYNELGIYQQCQQNISLYSNNERKTCLQLRTIIIIKYEYSDNIINL